MKQIKGLCLALVMSVVVVGFGAASALAASPTAKTLTGESFPIEISGSSTTAATKLQNTAGTLEGTGVSLNATLESASAGKYSSLFSAVNKKGEACENTGTNEVKVPLTGTEPFTLVHDISSTSGVAALLSVAELTVTCGATKIKISGNLLALLEPVGGGEKTTGFSGIVLCSTSVVGEPKDNKYWNAANEEIVPSLLANFGTGAKKACENISPNLALTATKMIELVA
jgi:hypothetical protein